jgi:hypothetical protein
MKAANALLSLVTATALLFAMPAVAAAGADAPDPDAKCLKCHSKKLKKTLEDGQKLSLQVLAADFEDSAHSAIGCTGCHRDVAKGKHPSREPISDARSYAVAQNETCRQCHAAKYESYRHSIHASLADAGDPAAPLCSDCHSAHAVQTMAVYDPVSGKPCKSCHEGIYEAYAQSVHGTARATGNVIREGHIQAPICADCHTAHDITAVASVDYLQTTCLDCHEGAALAHDDWLPNAALHLDSISCAACHAPVGERRVDLQLYDGLTHMPVDSEQLSPEVKARLEEVDASGDGLDPFELWKLLRRAGREGQAADVTLRGRMEVSTGVDAHRLAARSEAVRSCESCHQGNAEPFQNVTVSLSRPDGRKQRIEADKEVLSSAISLDSVGSFYAPGGTRIRLLDGLLALAIVGGLAIPVGHITLGAILRKRNRKQ